MASQQQEAKRAEILVEDPLDDGQESEFTGATLSLDASPPFSQDCALTAQTTPQTLPPGPVEPTTNISRIPKTNATVIWQVPFFSRSLPDYKRFFAIRDGAFAKAVEMCKPVMLENLDGQYRGAWLLTEIDHWDNEKERFIILTEKSLLVMKFDFITMNIVEYRRLNLRDIDCLIHGEISYPEKSLMPKIGGAMSHVKGFVATRLQRKAKSNLAKPNLASSEQEGFFRGKHAKGLRCMWNKGRPIQFAKNWNPWSREIPFITLTAHRLYFSEDVEMSRMYYDIDTFTTDLISSIRSLNANIDSQCVIKEERIVIENYVGIVSVVHNAADLGFFKSRGRVSF